MLLHRRRRVELGKSAIGWILRAGCVYREVLLIFFTSLYRNNTLIQNNKIEHHETISSKRAFADIGERSLPTGRRLVCPCAFPRHRSRNDKQALHRLRRRDPP